LYAPLREAEGDGGDGLARSCPARCPLTGSIVALVGSCVVELARCATGQPLPAPPCAPSPCTIRLPLHRVFIYMAANPVPLRAGPHARAFSVLARAVSRVPTQAMSMCQGGGGGGVVDTLVFPTRPSPRAQTAVARWLCASLLGVLRWVRGLSGGGGSGSRFERRLPLSPSGAVWWRRWGRVSRPSHRGPVPSCGLHARHSALVLSARRWWGMTRGAAPPHPPPPPPPCNTPSPSSQEPGTGRGRDMAARSWRITLDALPPGAP
jgi:hypothetical protein